jgi:outer membrane murein-binding lipoprotein Lpp
MENSQKVGLGCGTFILIAIIVLIFGNAGNEELSQDIQQLRQQVSDLTSSVQQLESKLEGQSEQLKGIRQLLEAGQPTTN